LKLLGKSPISGEMITSACRLAMGWRWLLLLALGLVLIGASDARAQVTYTVNTTSDVDDGVCDIASCSLREAINAANASPGADTIAFNLTPGVTTITLGSVLSDITDAVTIDGYSQPGSFANTNAVGGLDAIPVVEISGAGPADDLSAGLIIRADDVTVKGLILGRFQSTAILTGGAVARLTIAGNFIGTNSGGTAAAQVDMGGPGIGISAGSEVTIGGPAAADRNLIAGRTGDGVQILRDGGAAATKVTIQSNLIGTDVTGATALGNGQGIAVHAASVPNHAGDRITIGGATPALGNVISGSATHGVLLDNFVSDDPLGVAVTIERNLIGTAVSGAAMGNLGDGIHTRGPVDATVRNNVLAYNGATGIAAELGSSGGLTAGGRGLVITRNSIVGNVSGGIDLGADGRTPNDVGDADTGPNERLNFPTLIGAWFDADAEVLTVDGSIALAPLTTYTVELFSNANSGLARSGLDAASQVLGFPVTTDATGYGVFSMPVPSPFTLGDEVSATVTHPDGYTSEISDAISILDSGKPISGTVTLTNGMPVAGVTVDISGSNSLSGNVTTDVNGAYVFEHLPVGVDYIITPSMTAVAFAPPSRTFVNLTTGQIGDFTANPVTQIYTVNADDDNDDGTCDVAHCSLREAIAVANAHPGLDTIAFDIAPAGAVHTILSTTLMTPIADALLIDGYTQPGASPNTHATGGLNGTLKIELRPDNSGMGALFGLIADGPDVTIRGLAIGGYQIGIAAGLVLPTRITLEGSYLGTTADGLTAIPDGQAGLLTGLVEKVTVGGAGPAGRNLISGHVQIGVGITQGNGLASEVVVAGNLIGTDATGQQALGNGAGVVEQIYAGAPVVEKTRIGGATAAEGNVISGNLTGGIVATRVTDKDTAQVDREIANNYIGVAADGVTPLGNNSPGVYLFGATAWRVRENVIAHNTGAGIAVDGEPADDGRGVGISGNRIYGNAALAIDLGDNGRTVNDADDSDIGANDLQNFPVLLDARETLSGGATLTGELHSLANRTYTIEVFTTGSANQPGMVDARTFVGQVTANADASGVLAFSIDAGAVPAGESLVTTATDTLLDKTSELSDPIIVTAMPRYEVSGTVTIDGAALPDVEMRIDGSVTLSTTTDAAGHYAFVNMPAPGAYVVAPLLAGYVFTPPHAQFNGLSGDTVADFAAQLAQTEQHLAEGATGTFWQTSIFVLNPSPTPTTATLSFLTAGGDTKTTSVPLTGPGHAVINPALLPGLEQATFSTVVRAVTPIVASRTMRWGDDGQLGAHAEQAVSQPRTTWYFGEGATGCFKLFYLFVNPNPQPAEMTVTYVRRAPEAPVVLSYVVPPFSRYTVPVNDQPGLAFAEVGAQIEVTNGVPIVAERAMYSSCYGASWRGGHESAAAPSPATSWYLAEGATGSFFDLYILLANFKPADAEVDVRYLLADGTSFTKPYVVPANSRLTIDVAGEDARLAATSAGAVVTSTNAVPIVVERSQWWPHGHWYEGHASAAAPQAGVEWQLAGGEAGGPRGSRAYLLIANTSAAAGQAQVRLVFDDRTTADLPQPVTLAAYGRTTLDLGNVFPAARGKTFGVIVQSLGATPAPIVVELSIYNDTTLNGDRIFWGAGTNVVATRVR
jgi:CSLREA domain-containing protein